MRKWITIYILQYKWGFNFTHSFTSAPSEGAFIWWEWNMLKFCRVVTEKLFSLIIYPLIRFVDVFSNLIQWSGVQTNKTKLFSPNQTNAQASANGSRYITKSKKLNYLLFLYKCGKWIWFFCIWKETEIKQFLKRAIVFENLSDLHNIFCKLSVCKNVLQTCVHVGSLVCLVVWLGFLIYFMLSLSSLSGFSMEI